MKQLEGYELQIAGAGYLETELKKLVHSEGLSSKVKFLGKLRPEELREVTPRAFLGFSLEESSCLNYTYALPNKLFDYIHARVPVVVSDLPEMAKIVDAQAIGVVHKGNSPRDLAQTILKITNDTQQYTFFKANCNTCASEYCWEREEVKLLEIYKGLRA